MSLSQILALRAEVIAIRSQSPEAGEVAEKFMLGLIYPSRVCVGCGGFTTAGEPVCGCNN